MAVALSLLWPRLIRTCLSVLLVAVNLQYFSRQDVAPGEDIPLTYIDNSGIFSCCLLSAIWLGKQSPPEPLENLQYLVFSAIGNNN